MNVSVATEFNRKELELLFTALDQYQKYVIKHIESHPLINSRDNWELEDLRDRTNTLKSRIETVIASAKALERV